MKGLLISVGLLATLGCGVKPPGTRLAVSPKSVVWDGTDRWFEVETPNGLRRILVDEKFHLQHTDRTRATIVRHCDQGSLSVWKLEGWE